MADMDFPTSPTTGQRYTSPAGVGYIWNGTAWLPADPVYTSVAAFSRIFADVRKDLPSVVDAVLRQELFRVLDDFTQHTNVWQETFLVTVEPNVLTYSLPTPIHGQINRLMFAYVADQPTKYWPQAGITMRVPGQLMLYHSPMAGEWGVVVAKRTYDPLNAENYPNIDAWIVEKYADTLGRGIIARLQWEPQKPYSNPMLAAQNQRAYISGRSLARANDSHANVFDAQSWRFPGGWGVVQRKGYA